MALLGGSYNSSEHICYYPPDPKTGLVSTGVYRQCSSEADIGKVVGAEAAIIVFDEAPELEWEWIRLMGASVRVNTDVAYLPRVRYLGNPIGPSIDELWSYCIDKDVDRLQDTLYNPVDWRAIEISMDDNVNLNVEEYLKQFQGIPEHVKRAWVDGIRVVNGAYFVVDPKRHHVQQRPVLTGHVDSAGYIHPAPHIYRAIDWGWHDQMVCLWIAVYPNGRAIVFRELVRTHTTGQEVRRLIHDMSEGLTIRETFCDPTIFPPQGSDLKLAGNILEDSSEKNGIPLTPSHNDRTAAGFSISEWLNINLEDGLPALQFWQPGCPVLCKTLPSMRMDPKKPEKIADSSKDHATITLSYFTTAYTLNPRIVSPSSPATRISKLIRAASKPEPTRFGRLGVRR